MQETLEDLVLTPEIAEYARAGLDALAAAGVGSHNPARGSGGHDHGGADAVGRLLGVLGACKGNARELVCVDVAAGGGVLLLALRYQLARERAARRASGAPESSGEQHLADFLKKLARLWEASRASAPDATFVGVAHGG